MKADPEIAAQIAEEIAADYRRLTAKGLLEGSAGNISQRFESGMMITRTGIDGETITAADIVETDLDGIAEGDGIPSSEWLMHAKIYRRRPEIAAIVHTHADASTALACLGLPLPAFHYMVALFGGDDVRCAGYADFGSAALAKEALAALEGRTACLLANHGMIAVGADAKAAAKGTVTLETLARQYLMARQAGAPVLLSPAAMAEARRRFSWYGHDRIPES